MKLVKIDNKPSIFVKVFNRSVCGLFYKNDTEYVYLRYEVFEVVPYDADIVRKFLFFAYVMVNCIWQNKNVGKRQKEDVGNPTFF